MEDSILLYQSKCAKDVSWEHSHGGISITSYLKGSKDKEGGSSHQIMHQSMTRRLLCFTATRLDIALKIGYYIISKEALTTNHPSQGEGFLESVLGTSKALHSYNFDRDPVECCNQTETSEEVSILEVNVSWCSDEHNCVILPKFENEGG